MKASCAKATPPHARAPTMATRTTTWRTPNVFVRTVPATVEAVVCLMLRRCVVKDGGGADYNKRVLARLLPNAKLLRLVEVVETLTFGAQCGLRGREALAEPLARDPQRVLRIHLQRPGQGDDREQQIAHLLEHAVAVALRGELAVHRDLEQEVAELLHHLGLLAGVDGLEQLVGLLEQVRPERLVRLLPVPRAAIRRAQAVHDLEDGRDPLRERLFRHGRDITAAPRPAS